MRLAILALAGATAIGPAAASAQDEAQRRLDDMRRRIDNVEQQRRVQEVERRVDTLDLRVRTYEAQRDLDAQSIPLPAPTQPWISPAPPALPADLAAAAEQRRAALEASEARLRALSEAQKR
jgi:small-conductance mechanosensitive channel